MWECGGLASQKSSNLSHIDQIGICRRGDPRVCYYRAMHTMIRRAVPFLVVLTATAIASAEKLDNFKDAASKDGCEAIPYGDMQSNCRSFMKDVSHWCGGYKGPVKCDDGPTGAMLSRLKTEQQNLDNAKEKRRELEDKRSRTTEGRRRAELTSQIEATNKEIEAITKRIEEIKTSLRQQKDVLENIMYTITKCTESRKIVLGGVADVRTKVAGESDEALKSFASKVMEKLDTFKKGHESDITTLETSFGSCKRGMP